MPIKVQVLMSTYNGEKYLKQQIDSILSQKDVEIHLLVRDDGSTDNTINILKEYNNVEIVEGKNIGATNSFLKLIEIAGHYDFYAFSDQDDVWDNDKIITAINAIKKYDCPAIYSSDTLIVDDNLHTISRSSSKPKINLGSAIVRNYAAGCTTLFNSKLMEKLKVVNPKDIPYHDWWINIVAMSIGGVSFFDETPHIKYRQHGNNVVGASGSRLNKWKNRFAKFINKPYRRDIMAKQILDNYDVGDEEKRILQCVLNKKYIKEFKTGNFFDDLSFKICILTNRI